MPTARRCSTSPTGCSAKLGDAAVVLGGADGEKVALVASFAEPRSSAGLRPARWSARRPRVVGGGGGGPRRVAQAGGRDPEKLDEALEAARAAIESALAS